MQLSVAQPNFWQRKSLLAKLIISIACAISVSVLVISYQLGGVQWMGWQWQREALHGEMAKLGNGAVDRANPSLSKLLTTIPVQWFKSVSSSSDELPLLMLDVKFKHMRQIYERRELALERGVLIQQSDDLVPGSLRIGQRTVPIKLRLKGDWTDHLEGKKWSFRVQVRNGDQVMGMRRFSLQHPKVRGYQSELIYLGLLSQMGVLVPRYTFVQVILNGNDLGIMAFEEHFSKELLESQNRREGVIIRFDESLVWDATDGSVGEHDITTGFNGIYDDFRNAPIDAFRVSKIMESPNLSSQYESAVGLLRAFVEKKITAAKVFDPGLMGKYLAVTELLGTRHPTRWHNQRYYFNPVTMLLEPVGFDADLQNRIASDELVMPYEPLLLQMLEDPEVWKSFHGSLKKLIDEIRGGSLNSNILALQSKPLELLRREFYLLQPFPEDYISKRAEFLQTLSKAILTKPLPSRFEGVKELSRYPKIVRANHNVQGDLRNIELVNAVPYPVTIESISYQADPKQKVTQVVLEQKIELRARRLGDAPIASNVQLSGIPENSVITVNGIVRSGSATKSFSDVVATLPKSLYKHPILEQSVEEVLAKHPYIVLSESNSVLSIAKGDWNVLESIFVPTNHSLVIEAGTKLLFAPNAILISRGSLNLLGTINDPIKLVAAKANETWPGVVVLNAKKKSIWNYVHVDSTRGIDQGAWKLPGGVTFYSSLVEVNDSKFSNHTGEDALNIISSTFELVDSQISNAASDGFDCDFCDGSILRGELSDIAGDGLDFSMSTISITETAFRNISDKALSVGERSSVTATGLKISNSGTGAASKDGSYLEISESEIRETKVAAFMAYVKKPEFGAARIIADGIVLKDNRADALAQTNSQVRLNGELVPTQNLDVDKLYNTVMRPSIKK